MVLLVVDSAHAKDNASAHHLAMIETSALETFATPISTELVAPTSTTRLDVTIRTLAPSIDAIQLEDVFEPIELAMTQTLAQKPFAIHRLDANLDLSIATIIAHAQKTIAIR